MTCSSVIASKVLFVCSASASYWKMTQNLPHLAVAELCISLKLLHYAKYFLMISMKLLIAKWVKLVKFDKSIIWCRLDTIKVLTDTVLIPTAFHLSDMFSSAGCCSEEKWGGKQKSQELYKMQFVSLTLPCCC